MSNSLVPDQARHFVGPDLDPNCLQRLSADDTGSLKTRVKVRIFDGDFRDSESSVWIYQVFLYIY